LRNADTVTVSAAEFHRNVGKYQNIALTRPVTLTKSGRERIVLLSTDEYSRLKRRDRRALSKEELSEQLLEGISSRGLRIQTARRLKTVQIEGAPIAYQPASSGSQIVQPNEDWGSNGMIGLPYK
jgi:prevent-host-death family protein